MQLLSLTFEFRDVKRRLPGLLSYLAALAIFLVLSAPVRAVDGVHPNDTARFLAGLPPSAGSPLAIVARNPAWQAYAKRFDTVWANVEQRQLARISVWARANLANPQKTMFYMFSGPDFLYANMFFPHATTYVMSGLERIGPMPDPMAIEQPALASSLDQLWGSLDTILRWSYFITKDMQKRFSSGGFNGALPRIFVFLARTGHRIDRVNFVTLDKAGTVKPRGKKAPKGRPSGVEIRFAGSDGAPRTLYYFRTDLVDAKVKSSGFLKFCERLGQGDSLIKSASYLLHYKIFSSVRKFLLANSSTLVQDDSGIALRYFPRDKWELRTFGNYVGPIPVFKDQYQNDLAELFRREPQRPLKFGIGYRYPPNQTNILLAVRRGG